MTKWCDYVIIKVNYIEKENTKYINKVKIREDIGDKLINEKELFRQEIIKLLENKKIIITSPKGKEGRIKGEKVDLYDNKWIRTNPNDEKRDNLGELEEY